MEALLSSTIIDWNQLDGKQRARAHNKNTSLYFTIAYHHFCVCSRFSNSRSFEFVFFFSCFESGGNMHLA